MITLTFIEPSGASRYIQAAIGESIMHAATAAGVAGIAAECGGACMCATCHCLVVEAPDAGLPEMSETERDVLEFTSDEMQETSRLTCQIPVADTMDGTVFKVVGR
ncbi:2Fe-2S iron-sulfur cluster-binding protein [Marinovum sp.]|uniref:2Fe-2S iron-sulfur cluster-binding protein n=1 Tax=Marinovum sp. TaxID=2024839 RepID=UPI002B2672FE|nr:2Fe-2S iron-sulfur cluster-binding protein [Marinovum sp.]